MTSARDQVFDLIVGFEGGYGCTSSDPGDWTGGRVGQGQLEGTAYGQSAASYADNLVRLDSASRAGMPAHVKDLTRAQVQTIFGAVYWAPIRGDSLPISLALLVADAAYNSGPPRAAQWLQQAVGAPIDRGDIGPITLARMTAMAKAQGGRVVLSEFMAIRMAFMAALPTWPTFGGEIDGNGRPAPKGWARRLALLPFEAIKLELAQPMATAPIVDIPPPATALGAPVGVMTAS